MTQKRNLIFLFCVFFILLPFSSFSQSSNKQYLYKNIEACSNSLVTKFAPLHNVVSSAYSGWQWHVTNKVREKATILIEFENNLFIYGLHNLKKELSANDLKTIGKSTSICIYRNANLPYLYIQRHHTKQNPKENGFYAFLHPGFDDQYGEISILKNYFGSILYTNLELMTEISYVTLEVKITHEAIHLFGQPELQNYQPEFKINEEFIAKEDEVMPIATEEESCKLTKDSAQELSSRQYLQLKEKCSRSYNESVRNEICLDNKLIDIISNNRIPNKLTRNQVLTLMNEIKKELRQRTMLFDDQDLQLEWYWYLIEGVPQYLEQKVSLNKDIDRISNHYKSYCSKEDGYQGIFFPLLTGAAIWHGFEYLFDNTNHWDGLALPSEYNVKSSENSKEWFDEFQSILDKYKEQNEK